jgi:uracil DNA glycosylase
VLTGVLLLNACLTVRAHNANSHKDQGWEQLTDAVVKYISDNSRGVVFLLWGSYAQKKAAAVDKVPPHFHVSLCITPKYICVQQYYPLDPKVMKNEPIAFKIVAYAVV